MTPHSLAPIDRRAPRARAFVLAAFTGLALSSPPALAETLPEHTELGYDVYFGGQLIAKADATVDWSDSDYRIGGTVQTVGFVNWLTEYRGDTESRGMLKEGSFVPVSHRNFGSFRGRERLTEVRYDTQQGTDFTVEPEPDWSELTPLPENPGQDTLDPLSTVIAVAFSMKDGAECQGSYPIFDGRRRYDVTVEQTSTRDLEGGTYGIFTGQAATCAVTDFNRLGGFRLEGSKYTETMRRREAYVARLGADGLPVPVRIEVHTDYGALIVHLTRYKGQGLDLMLQQES